MIRFRSVTYSNIMSVGNTPITVSLDGFNKTLITGTNGAGKSTYIEAVCFALYGKPFRNIKKTQIVNAVNKKKLLVEIEFQDKRHVYKIVRGIKPNKFEIYKDDELIPQEAAVADYQDMLEKNILQMSMSTFKQIAVLGTAGFTPFMLLPAGKRREIVEDLLDIGIFSDMASINKLAIKDLNTKIGETEADVERRMNELRLHVEFQKEQQNNRDGDLAQLETRQTEAETELKPLEEQISCAEDQIHSDSVALRVLKDKLEEALTEAKQIQLDELTQIDAAHSVNAKDLQDQHTDEVNALKTKHTSEQDAIDAEYEADLLEFDRVQAENLSTFDKETAKLTPEEVDSDKIGTDTSTFLMHKKEITQLKENKAFFEENGDCECSTCKQTISSKFAQDVIDMADKRIETLTAEAKALGVSIKAAQEKAKARTAFINERATERSSFESTQRTERSTHVQGQSTARQTIARAQQDEMNTLVGDVHNPAVRELNAAQSKERADLVAKHAEHNADLTKADASAREELTANIGKDKTTHAAAVTKQDSLMRTISTIKADIADVKSKAATEDRSGLIKEQTADVKRVKKNLINDLQTKHCRSIVATLLKDDGVKSMIVKQYIPLINKYINDYLKTMNANYNFVLDEEFNETIKSRGRDDFSYTSFSQGERCRIDLALLFSFRDLVSARTGSMTNLLVFDEILDGPSDADAVDAFNAILSSLKSNVFVISHSDKHEQSAYDNHIKFTKKGNFTREV